MIKRRFNFVPYLL